MSGNQSREATPPSSDQPSLDYYSHNAERFFLETVGVDMANHRARFLAHVPPGGRILDAGCGSGRDAKSFLEAGYAVTAFDGSVEMARRASALLGRDVLHLRFEEMAFREEFNGIWACASLLHVPKTRLPETLRRFAAALRSDGVLYLSFKLGEGERRKEDGRYFLYMTEQALAEQLAATQELRLWESWLTYDVRPQRAQERWLNCLAKKLHCRSS